MTSVKDGVLAVVGRFLLCWAMIAALVGFVVSLGFASLFLLDPRALSPEGSDLVVPLMLLAIVIGGINAPWLWSIADSLLGASRLIDVAPLRYAVAVGAGIGGGVSLYFELTTEFPTIQRVIWIGDAMGVSDLVARYNDGVDFTQMGLAFAIAATGNLVCLVSVIAPAAAVYINRRHITRRTPVARS